VRWQVQHGSALGLGDPGRDGDEGAAQGRASRDGLGRAGQGSGGSEQVWVIAAHNVQALLAANRSERCCARGPSIRVSAGMPVTAGRALAYGMCRVSRSATTTQTSIASPTARWSG
jgi:hypothetical protein